MYSFKFTNVVISNIMGETEAEPVTLLSSTQTAFFLDRGVVGVGGPYTQVMPSDIETVSGQEQPILAAEITAALVALARNGGNCARTAREIAVPRETLRNWKQRYRDEYLRLAAELLPQIEQQQIVSWSEIQTVATEAALLAVQRTRERLERDEDNQPHATARNMAVTAAVGQDKRLVAEGRPNQITRVESVEQLIAELDRKALAIEDAEVIDDEGESVPELPPAA